MSYQYVGEVRPTGFNFAPEGWLSCNGQLLAISEYETLYDLVGTTYGGDGVNTFAVPDLRGRAVVHQGSRGGSSYPMGLVGGLESVTLTSSQIPVHTHPIQAQDTAGSSDSPNNTFIGPYQDHFASVGPAVSAPILSAAGGNQLHANLMPYLCVNYIIAYTGVFPSQN